jgi:dethiobiotin synthetase
MSSKNARGFFVTGTDTGIGKTTVTRLLILALNQCELIAMGCKPIACGDREDAMVYSQVNPIPLCLDRINPLYLTLPASPNIAAKQANKVIALQDLTTPLKGLLDLPVDYVFFEGVGGWKVPLTDTQTTVDLALDLAFPLIVVVGIRVGCLNHTLLTWDSITRTPLKVAGWIANVIVESTPAMDEHIATLGQHISAPYLGMVPYQATTWKLLSHSIDLKRLTEWDCFACST